MEYAHTQPQNYNSGSPNTLWYQLTQEFNVLLYIYVYVGHT